MTTISYAMDKTVHYIVHLRQDKGVTIDFFLPSQEPDKPKRLIKTINLNENQTKALIMPLVREAKEAQAWRAWTTKWNAARL